MYTVAVWLTGCLGLAWPGLFSLFCLMLFSSHMLVCARTLRIVARLFGKRLFATPNFVTSAAGRPTSLPADFDNRPISRSFVSDRSILHFSSPRKRGFYPEACDLFRYQSRSVTRRFYYNDRFFFFLTMLIQGLINTRILGTGIDDVSLYSSEESKISWTQLGYGTLRMKLEQTLRK